MSRPEQPTPPNIAIQQTEIIDPAHHYAAHIFDQPETRRTDIAALVDQAKQLGYPV